MNYVNLISKIKKNKYQNYLNLTEKFYHSYIASRLATIDKLKRKRIKKKIKIFSKKNYEVFFTFEYLYKVFYKFNKTKNISKKDTKIIYSLYKKFETNLLLRESYNRNLLKKSKFCHPNFEIFPDFSSTEIPVCPRGDPYNFSNFKIFKNEKEFFLAHPPHFSKTTYA